MTNNPRNEFCRAVSRARPTPAMRRFIAQAEAGQLTRGEFRRYQAACAAERRARSARDAARRQAA